VRDGEIHEIELPRAEARPRRIAVAGGAVWYVDYAGGYLGRYDPDSGEIDEWAAPAGSQARPYAMAADDAGRLWFVETGIQPNRFVGFDPDMETFTEPVEIASGGGTVRHMVFDPETRTIWFGTDTNTIGRAALE
jgi:virginiamycin B lyase